MAETDLLSFLVDETFKLHKNGKAKLSSLELKLIDYRLEFMKGEFIPQAQVLRFSSKIGMLDIPVNWSIFANSNSSDWVLSEENDQDHLFKVIKSAWNDKFVKILITHADGFCYLVGLEAGDETRIHDLIHPQKMLKTA